MPRPIEALVHLDALAANLAVARRFAAGARVWAVVKADAYGHGVANVFPALKSADGFALLDIAEASLLRGLGWRGPVLLLEGCFDARDLEVCSRLDLWHTVHEAAQIDRLAAHKTERPHHVFLKMNSGMNRLGFTSDSYRAAWLRLDALPQVEAITLMTHFANADLAEVSEAGPGNGTDVTADLRRAHSIEAALAAFDAVTADLPGERSVGNSAALLCHGERLQVAATDWARPGVMLYGSSPDYPAHSAADWALQPAMTLRSELIALQRLRPGAAVGYGSGFTADRDMTIGIVACGYADGYPRVAPGGNTVGTPVLVDGVRTRTVGRVSMDMIAVDLTPVANAAVGSEVVLWGRASNGALLSIDEIAQAAGTIGYELMCARAPRVSARVVGGADR